MIGWGRTQKLSRMVAERDGWLLQREARLRALEAAIAELEEAARTRERAADREIARREQTIRDREERIAWLEAEIRRHENPRQLPRRAELPLRLRELVARLPGWCPAEKAGWMADTIIANSYRVAAEIGVFAGRSVLPIALAIAANDGEAVYAVDAWDNAAATAGATADAAWWDDVDLVGVKHRFLRETIALNLAGLIKIVELPSRAAYAALAPVVGRGIGFLHIDAAHSESEAMFDATSWSQLVAPGGTIVLDDVDWPGVRAAAAFLADRYERVAAGDDARFAAFRVVG